MWIINKIKEFWVDLDVFEKRVYIASFIFFGVVVAAGIGVAIWAITV